MLEIINKLNELEDELCSFLNTLKVNEVSSFNIFNYNENINWALINCPGIYMFSIQTSSSCDDIQEWITHFKNLWEIEKYKWKYVPNTKKKRITAHLKKQDFIPLYLGKSKNISARVRQHIEADINKTTFAMKLRMRENLVNYQYKLFYYPITNNKHYDYLSSKIEAFLREKYNPIVGKQ